MSDVQTNDVPGRAEIEDAMARNDERARMQLRALARRSLYFLTKAVVGFKHAPNLMTSYAFKERQDWLQWVITEKRRGLLEDPRNMIKSWGSTVSGSMWCASQRATVPLDHPNEVARAAAFLEANQQIKGPDTRLVVYSDSAKQAMKWVGVAQRMWQMNEFWAWLRPELQWPNFNRPGPGLTWSVEGLHLPGMENPLERDPWLRPAGIDSKEQGGRAEGVWVEDIVGETSYRSSTEITKRRQNVRTIGNLLRFPAPVAPNGGFMIIVGNRWTLSDVNSMVHDEFDDWAIWRRSVWKCSVHDFGNCGRWQSDADDACTPTDEPLWKEMYPDREAVAHVQVLNGPENFAAQFENNPLSVSDLDARQLGVFTVEPRTLQSDAGPLRKLCVVVRQASGQGHEIIPVDALTDHCVSADPAASTDPRAALSAWSWVAFDRPTRRRFWLDAKADRWGPDKTIDTGIELIQSIRTTLPSVQLKILCEKVAAQDYVASALRREARLQGITDLPGVTMVPVPRGLKKTEKIKNVFGMPLGQGLVYVRAGLPGPAHETRRFPTGTLDLLDTFVQCEIEVFQGKCATLANDKAMARRLLVRERRIRDAGPTGVELP